MNISAIGRASAIFTPPELKAKEEPTAQEKQEQAVAEEKKKQAQLQAQLAMYQQELEAADEQAEAVEESFSTFGKCMRIAMRITNGDKVPLKDIDFLMEHEPDLYKQAIMMRRPNDEPKEWESVLDEEDEKAPESKQESNSSEAPPAANEKVPAAEAGTNINP